MNNKLICRSWIGLSLITNACGRADQPPPAVFPQLPALSAETRKPCPPAAELADGALGTLALADTALAIEYARCQARAASAVGAYETARAMLSAADEKAAGR